MHGRRGGVPSYEVKRSGNIPFEMDISQVINEFKFAMKSSIIYFKGAVSRNCTQTFCVGQLACMRDFVYKSLCLTKWWTRKHRVGLPFLSPEFK